MRRARVAVGAVAMAMSLAWAAPALGITFCVSDPGCTGISKPGVQEALSAAKARSGPDIIRVGAGTFHGPFTDEMGNVVTLVGAGDRTKFVNPAGSTSGSPSFTLEVAERTSTFLSFAVVVPPGASGTGITSLGTVEHALVTDLASDTNDTGAFVASGAFSHSRIVLRGSASGFGVPTGLAAGGFLQDDLVHMFSPGAVGVEASPIFGSEARQLTLVGPGDAAVGPDDSASRGIRVRPNSIPGTNSFSTITLDGVIIRGFAHALAAEGSQVPNTICFPGPCTPDHWDNVATINVSYSDFDPSNDIKAPTDSTINDQGGNVNLDPRFTDPSAGEYTLHRGSPVIDHGDPAVPRAGDATHPADSTTDLAGNPRRSDGNGDHAPVADIGAYEYTNHPPVAVIHGPVSAMVGRAVRFSGMSSHDPDRDPMRYLWRFGDGNQSRAPNPSHTYFKPGSYTVRLVVSDPLGARSAPAVARIKITPPCVVPELQGKRLNGARQALSAAHCTLGTITQRRSGQVAKGRVISSQPPAGTHLPTAARVALTVSRGR